MTSLSDPRSAAVVLAHPRLRLAGLLVLVAGCLAGMVVGMVTLPPADAAFLAGWLAYPAVGGVIILRQPGHHVGWFTLSTGAGWALAGVAAGAITVSGSELDAWWALVQHVGFLVAEVSLGMVIILFPHPTTTSRGQRVLVGALTVLAGLSAMAALLSPVPADGVATPSPFGVQALADVTAAILAVASIGFPALLVVVLAFVGRRYRRSEGIERLQYRWFAAGVLVMVIAFVGSTIISVSGPLLILPTSAPPVAIGIAIVRYRLYEIDRLISRTTTYALVTGVLVAVYALVVTAVSRLLPESGALAVAGATLAAAAAFRPVLRRVQAAVDRRFNRAKYDAALEVEAYARSLRDGVNPDDVAAGLVLALERTLQPSVLGVWRGGPS